MPFSLVPDRVFDRYADITPAYLSERGVTLLLSDLDFTLAAKSTRRPDQPLRDWIAGLKAAGIDFMIVSNNRSGVLARMVEPVGGPVTAWQKVLHALQSPFKAVCRRRTAKIG